MVSTDQLIPVGFVALFVLIGLLILAGGIGRLRAWWRLKGSEASAPGSLDTGPVELEGTARSLEETLTSPRENADSLVYEHVVKEKHVDHDPDQGSRTEWRTVVNETETVPFVVEGGLQELRRACGVDEAPGVLPRAPSGRPPDRGQPPRRR